MPSDRTLLERVARDRDAGAFDTLAERFRGPLHRQLRSLTHDGTADDLLQETLLRLWTEADSFDGHGSVRGWLFRIAANLASNHRRSLARRREDALPERFDSPDPLPAPEELALRAESRQQVRAALDELDEARRELVRLAYAEELPLADIADRFGIPAGTVKSRLHHARRRLRDALENPQ